MAAPSKGGSRWGNLLSQAVAGVESRLDTILAEDDDPPAKEQQNAAGKAAKASQPPHQAGASKSASGTTRPASSNRANDRLQARLAKAMAAKNARDGKGTPSPRSSMDQSARSSIDKPANDRARPEASAASAPDETSKETPKETSKTEEQEKATESPESATNSPRPSTDEQADSKPTQHADSESTAKENLEKDTTAQGEAKTEPSPETAVETVAKTPAIDQPPPPEPAPSFDTPAEDSAPVDELEAIKALHQEEIQDYVERIDSLQAKLQYLSNTAANEAKEAAAAASPGSDTRKLAEKDEKIALLLEEGRKLSSSEQKYRATIRKLRTQVIENEKQAKELKKEREDAAAEAEALKNRISSEERERLQEEAQKARASLQAEIDSLKRENATKDETIRRMGREAKSNAEYAESTKADALRKLQATERDKQKALEDIINGLKADKAALDEKQRLDTIEWQEKLDRAVERGRKVEEELKNELRMMESKLEAMRTAAEEASSASGGEAQLKLLRQIETLQSQYASASDNWQGIETSLLAKAANLEKERDEAQRRESEMRKKARDSASRCRTLEDELQDVNTALVTAQQELESCRDQLKALQTSSKTTETALEQARAELEKQRVASRDFSGESDRRQWVDDVATGPSSKNHSRPDSPLMSISRTFSSDLVGGLPVPGRPRRVPTPGSIPDSTGEGVFFGRRLSSQPPIRNSGLGLVAASPGLPPTPFSPFEAMSESAHGPSPSVADRDDGLDDNDPSSPRNVAQDMVSVSTVGAGPSVQLVERMSAAIRRLEAEKVAAKEEMARVCGQRDEARSDILNLMKDLEASKSATARLSQLEQEVATVNERYQTTLEMLGEKTELVEELQADVQDVKAMYRELVERTVK